MKKKQAEEYFWQLKKVDKDRSIKMAQLVNILTGGAITVREFYQFIDYIKGNNEFGEYSHIDPNIEQKDWRQLEFPQVYQLLKAIKDFIVRAKGDKNKELSDLHTQNRDLGSSAHDNSTVMDLLSGLSPVPPVEDPLQEEKRLQEKWKNYKLRVLKKLLIIFDYYRKGMHVKDETFQKNQSITEKFDLAIFMRYFREFELIPAFELKRVTRVFKANAINSLWLDFDSFVNTHLHLIGFKETLSNQDKYLKLRGFNELLTSEKMKRMLNIRREHIVTSVVEGHTGAYTEDIIKHLQMKAQERREKIKKKWSGKSLKTQRSDVKGSSIHAKHGSMKNLQRANTEAAPSVYEELKLPKLRLKQHRQQSVYHSLNMLDLSREQEKIKEMVGEENEQFLQQYLKEEGKLKEKAKIVRKPVELPRMRFT